MSTALVIQTVINLLGNDRAAEAIEKLDSALANTPRDPQLLQLKAASAWQIGDLYGADDALHALVDANGGPSPQTDLMTAQLALDLLEFGRARAAIERLTPADRAALHLRGLVSIPAEDYLAIPTPPGP